MLDLEEYYQTQSLIEKIEDKRGQLNHDKYLAGLSVENDYAEIEMTLQLLSQMDFDEVLPHEEEFTLRMLESDEVALQEQALNALLLWNKTTQFERVKKVKLQNRYLQKDLDDFIKEVEKSNGKS